MFKKILIISILYADIGLVGAVHKSERQSNNLPDDIVKAFTNSDSKGVGKFFNMTVELTFSESQGVYGKAQAEQILKTFFINNASTNGRFNYKHLHGSDRDNVQYYIGELLTGKGLYRVTIHMKDQLIYRMRIESND